MLPPESGLIKAACVGLFLQGPPRRTLQGKVCGAWSALHTTDMHNVNVYNVWINVTCTEDQKLSVHFILYYKKIFNHMWLVFNLFPFNPISQATQFRGQLSNETDHKNVQPTVTKQHRKQQRIFKRLCLILLAQPRAQRTHLQIWAQKNTLCFSKDSKGPFGSHFPSTAVSLELVLRGSSPTCEPRMKNLGPDMQRVWPLDCHESLDKTKASH